MIFGNDSLQVIRPHSGIFIAHGKLPKILKSSKILRHRKMFSIQFDHDYICRQIVIVADSF